MLRTHTCNELRAAMAGEMVILCGWAHTIRPHGNVVFIDLRDRYGITQAVFDANLKDRALKIKKESVIMVKGKVARRTEINKKLPTGDAEVSVLDFEILSESEKLPIDLADDTTTTEDTRLKHRVLDLRRGPMKRAIIMRHEITKAIRDFYDTHEFLEIETPFLTKSTPEGARDYLVPSRVHRHRFFALPQSPQIFKQLFMIAGFDRYFQIVRCFRDEDLRADRQPEFTQLDVEMSFVNEEDIFAIHEELMRHLFRKVLRKDIKTPFPRFSHEESMHRFGTDSPDIRFGMELFDISDTVRGCGFRVFADTIKQGGTVAGICAPGCAGYSRKQLDELTELAKVYDAKGLVALKVLEKGRLEGAVAKFLDAKVQESVIKAAGAKKDDLLLLVADKKHHIVQTALGELRLHLGRKLRLIGKDSFVHCWIAEFPLLEYDEEEKRHVAVHHPFTSPKPEHLRHLDKHPEKVKARAYDLVLNGTEIAGGSIRIHQLAVQQKMFRALGIGDEEARRKFGFLLDAFRYGAPPHGGIAFGLDRLVAIMTGNTSIREVIAFPKNKHCMSMLEDAPSVVDKKQLDELGISLKK